MNINEALKVLEIEKCDCLGYARDLSVNPSRKEVGEAIEVVEDWIRTASNVIVQSKANIEKVLK